MKRILLLSLSLILLLSLSAFAQDAQQNLTLIVTGQPGQIPIVQIERQVLRGHRCAGASHEQFRQYQGESGYLDPARFGPEHAGGGPRTVCSCRASSSSSPRDSQRMPSLPIPHRRRSRLLRTKSPSPHPRRSVRRRWPRPRRTQWLT